MERSVPTNNKEKRATTHTGEVKLSTKCSGSPASKVKRSSSFHDTGHQQARSGGASAIMSADHSRRHRHNSISDPPVSTSQQPLKVSHSTTSSAAPAQTSTRHSAAQVSNTQSALTSNARQLLPLLVHEQIAARQRQSEYMPSPAPHGRTFHSAHKSLLPSLSPEERVSPLHLPSSTPTVVPKGSPAVSRSYRGGITAGGLLGDTSLHLTRTRIADSPSGVEPTSAALRGQPLSPQSAAPRNLPGSTYAPSVSLLNNAQPVTAPGPPVDPRTAHNYIPSSPRERRRTASISLPEQRTNNSSLSSNASSTHAQASPLAPSSPNSASTTKPASFFLDDQKTSGKEKTVLAPYIASVKSVVACGLKNLGNTCYMNAVIQVMRHIHELNGPLLRFCGAAKMKPDSILKSYGDLVRDMQDPGVLGPVSLRSFKDLFDRKCPRFSGYDQQDATEFMRLLINEMHEEWKALSIPLPHTDPSPVPVSPRPSLKMADTEWLQLLNTEKTDIAECFMGMYKSSIKCLTCNTEAVKFEPFWDLSVPFPQQMDLFPVVQLETCLDLFTKEEKLDKDEKPYCDKCSAKRTSAKKLTLQKHPTVIAIVLKRFAHTRFGTVRKIETTVSVPFTLDMNKYTSNTGCTSTKYSLFGVVNHVGTDRFGHYTAWCKNNLEWNIYNDSKVTKVSPSETCLETKDAYALFYRPVATDVI